MVRSILVRSMPRAGATQIDSASSVVKRMAVRMGAPFSKRARLMIRNGRALHLPKPAWSRPPGCGWSTSPAETVGAGAPRLFSPPQCLPGLLAVLGLDGRGQLERCLPCFFGVRFPLRLLLGLLDLVLDPGGDL